MYSMITNSLIQLQNKQFRSTASRPNILSLGNSDESQINEWFLKNEQKSYSYAFQDIEVQTRFSSTNLTVLVDNADLRYDISKISYMRHLKNSLV